MSEPLRTGEEFLKKLAATMDGIAMEMGQMKDGEMKRKANNALWDIRLYFCMLTRRAMEDEKLAERISPTLRELAEKSVESPFFGALCGMLEVEHGNSHIGFPTEIVDRVDLETIEERRDRLKRKIAGKIGRDDEKEREGNRMWA